MPGRRWLAPAVVYGVILGLSSIPDTGFDGLDLPEWTAYVAHAVEYGALGAALRWAIGPDAGGKPVLVAVCLGALAGAIDETYQRTVPGRDASLLDWVVDVAAVSSAAAVVHLVHRSRIDRPAHAPDRERLP